MHSSNAIDVERILAMVDASAAVVAPEDREDLFEEFAEDLRETGRVPGDESAPLDDADAGIADTHVFLGIGLTLLDSSRSKSCPWSPTWLSSAVSGRPWPSW
ncbi:hypothetical protein [Streptomyces sp. NPDC001978]|uniref:hypothetical protein n=1 Tax=Streptomyces sp. NPDC001978 TaxID=3364627 RepID=UPI0036A1B22C